MENWERSFYRFRDPGADLDRLIWPDPPLRAYRSRKEYCLLAFYRPIRSACAFCRHLELFSEASVAIDGSKFKAVNTRGRNFTQAKMQRRLAQIDESIARYLSQLDSADRQGEAVPEAKITRLNEKIAALRQEIQRLNQLNAQMMQTEDQQISLTDPDARSMATSGRGSGMVGYNVQSAVDTKHHLIVAHEVTNVGSDRSQLSDMAERARSRRPKCCKLATNPRLRQAVAVKLRLDWSPEQLSPRSSSRRRSYQRSCTSP